MTKTLRARHAALIVTLQLLLAPAGPILRAAWAAPPPAGQSLGPVPARKVRIGLTTDPVKARVSAAGGIVIRDPVKREPIWKKRFDGGVYLVSELSGSGGVGLLYRVQVASFTDRGQAEAKKTELETLLPGEKVTLDYNPDRRAWRVRVGEFRAREDAADLVERLGDRGFTELWVAEESRAAVGRRRIRLVDDRWRDFLTGHDRVRVTPVRAGEVIRLDDTAYRGILEARVNKSGRLQVINEIDMEDYLKGVVPNEMGPGVFPELQALMAQAVAARTYIVANLGQFSEEGYDICDGPQCQVYRGPGSEHPLTDQAVEETRGLVLTWEGRPINAMYTSTCGGHTEDGHLVFPEMKAPYLKGVPCYPEVESEGHSFSGRAWIDPVVLEDGAPASEAISLMQAIGVVGSEALDRAYLLARCSAADAEIWTARALGRVGKKPPRPVWNDGAPVMHDLAGYFARSLGWDEKLKLSLDDRDLPYLLAFKDRDEVPGEARRPYAVLILEGILEPFPDNTLRPRHHPSRGLVLRSLYRILDYYDAAGIVRTTYRGSAGDRILLEEKQSVHELGLSPDVALFRSFRDISYPAQTLALVLGDRVHYHQAEDGTIDYLKVIANQRGVSDDRYSSAYRWEQRYTRAELEALIASRLSVGRLADIEPTKRGVSGRVVEVRITGSRGQFYMRGFRIRTALGIRENLFTVDRTLGPDGQVESYIFSGKGWGHGVGLCQVGAYGMALRGKSYEEILRHYYSGAELTRPGGS
jgi:stage II sporulation protein D